MNAMRIPSGALAFALTVLTATPGSAVEAGSFGRAGDPRISISGTIQEVGEDSLRVDYGTGSLTAEMDDRDRDARAYSLYAGDKVKVTGVLDERLYDNKTIQATSLYIEKLGTRFHADGIDQEEAFTRVTAPLDVSETTVQGEVVEVSDKAFLMDTGARRLRIEVDEMPYNPLDAGAYRIVDKGDRISVTGQINEDFFELRTMKAKTLTVLSEG